MKRCIKFFVFVLLFFVIFACNDEGNDGVIDGESSSRSNENDTGSDENDTDLNQTPEYYSGFDFVLTEGDYWEYYWSSYKRSGSQDSNSSSSDSGSFTITLGAHSSVGDLDAYPLLTTGKTTDSNNFQFSPKWTHIAISDNQIYGSTNGTTFEVIFVAASTQWEGGGFFTDFGTSKIETLETNVSNNYISTSAIMAKRYKKQGQCEYFPGVGTVCPNDESYTISEKEYYKAGIGPAAYRYSFSYSNNGGGFTTWMKKNRELGLVSTNLSSPDGFQASYPPWYRKTPLTSPITAGYSAAAIDRKIYITGGSQSGSQINTLNIYDVATNSWSTGASMPSERSNHGSVAINGKLYVTGTTIFEYDPVLDSWSTISPSMKSSGRHIAVEIDGMIVTLGGSSAVEFVYPEGASGFGSKMPRMPRLGGAALGMGENRRIYICGGVRANPQYVSCKRAEYFKNCFKLNPFSDWEWTSVKSMPTVRADLSVVELNNKLYTIGGRNCKGSTNVVEMYDPELHTWTTVSPMLSSTQKGKSAVVDGKIYVFYANDGKINVEEYDPDRE
ncbi:MAG: hypothetical protein GY730_07055 [bacterium]|nr:hypothetical protein [bacterium]